MAKKMKKLLGIAMAAVLCTASVVPALADSTSEVKQENGLTITTTTEVSQEGNNTVTVSIKEWNNDGDKDAAVAINGASSSCFIKTAVWVARLHGVAILGADTKNPREFIKYNRGVVCLCTKGASKIMSHIHAIAALVIQNDAISPGRHTTVHSKGRCDRRNCAVVPVYTDACRSRATRSTSGSSLPRSEALRRIPRHALGLK